MNRIPHVVAETRLRLSSNVLQNTIFSYLWTMHSLLLVSKVKPHFTCTFFFANKPCYPDELDFASWFDFMCHLVCVSLSFVLVPIFPQKRSGSLFYIFSSLTLYMMSLFSQLFKIAEYEQTWSLRSDTSFTAVYWVKKRLHGVHTCLSTHLNEWNVLFFCFFLNGCRVMEGRQQPELTCSVWPGWI